LIFKNFPYLDEFFAFIVDALPKESKISDAIAIFLIIPVLLFDIKVKYFKIDLDNKVFPDPISIEKKNFAVWFFIKKSEFKKKRIKEKD
jgi:hypothetical protein